MKHKDKIYLYVSPTNYISSDYFPKFLDTNKEDFNSNINKNQFIY